MKAGHIMDHGCLLRTVLYFPPASSAEPGSSGLYHFFKDLFFKNTFRFTTKLKGRYTDYPYTTCPHT